jgi:hypothetical protein
MLGLFAPLVAVLVWGWIRWSKRAQSKTLLPIMSLIGFALATASALLALSTMLYAQAIGGFQYHDPRLLRIYRWGALLSLTGTVSALVGVSQPGPLRWHSPFSAVGTLAFWIVAANGE